MKFFKMYVSLLLSVCVLGSIAFAGRVSYQIGDTDTRFQPIDAFHKGCEQSALLRLGVKEKGVTKIHLVMAYDPNQLEISRVNTPDSGIGTYKIEYDRLIVDQSSPIIQNGSVDLVRMTFKGTPQSTGVSLLVGSGSYLVSNGKKIYLEEYLSLPFAQVPECDPDVIPPSIRLIFPTNISDLVAMDQYFIFDIKDSGKGIDKTSLKIDFLDKTYTSESSALKWKGDYLTFYPETRLPLGTKTQLKITLGDKQIYGGANSTTKDISFQTTSGVTFLDPMAPAIFRQMARGAEKLFATPDECALLWQQYTLVQVDKKNIMGNVLDKLACSPDTMSGDLQDVQPSPPQEKTNKAESSVSVFAALGWLLFVITLILKLHYLVSYKKHKKLAEKYRKE